MQSKICITGLGHIGLPIACILAETGYKVLGIDIDANVLTQISSLSLTNPEPNLQELLTKCIYNGNLRVSTKPEEAEIHIIAVPTPLDNQKNPDISYVEKAISSLLPLLRSQDLILIESTCPIGTTAKISEKLRSIIPDVYVAYCPERILPGNALYELVHNSRIIGGIDQISTLKASQFYRSFVKAQILETTPENAEAVKLAENAYRDINIAYANELSMIFDHLNLDVREIIKLANYHPRVNILQPGSGVGGHCIAIDPLFLASSAPNLASLIKQARTVNTNKTAWVIDKIRNTINKNRVQKIACLGVTYKPNVSDIRESPALHIISTLAKEFDVLRVDPNLSNTIELYDAISQADMVVGLVAHNEFSRIAPDILKDKILLDFAGIFK
jgi:UDP-N-acetyl-D-mannosaminuronic acid dehydrogenase